MSSRDCSTSSRDCSTSSRDCSRSSRHSRTWCDDSSTSSRSPSRTCNGSGSASRSPSRTGEKCSRSSVRPGQPLIALKWAGRPAGRRPPRRPRNARGSSPETFRNSRHLARYPTHPDPDARPAGLPAYFNRAKSPGRRGPASTGCGTVAASMPRVVSPGRATASPPHAFVRALSTEAGALRPRVGFRWDTGR
jgi:hypothetical protein